MTCLSDEFLDEWRERLRQAMLGHPQHHLNWRLRRDFYVELGNETPEARAFRGWLAVLCAQKVLPIAMTHLPDESLPFQQLSAALQLLKGGIPAESIQRLLDAGYHFVYHECLDGSHRRDVQRAVFCGYKALLEAQGEFQPDPFGGLGPEWVDSAEAEFQSAATAEAASYAATAWAGSSGTDDADILVIDPERLRDFWLWWLDEGWPIAFQLAQRFQFVPRLQPDPVSLNADLHSEPLSEYDKEE